MPFQHNLHKHQKAVSFSSLNDESDTYYNQADKDTDREQYLSSLFDAATTYEALEKKETDYELLCQLNNSGKIKNQITENLKAMSGLTVVDENNFEDVLDKLASQLK